MADAPSPLGPCFSPGEIDRGGRHAPANGGRSKKKPDTGGKPVDNLSRGDDGHLDGRRGRHHGPDALVIQAEDGQTGGHGLQHDRSEGILEAGEQQGVGPGEQGVHLRPRHPAQEPDGAVQPVRVSEPSALGALGSVTSDGQGDRQIPDPGHHLERERQRLARFDPPDPQQVKGFSRGGPVRPGPPEVRDLTRKHAVVQEHPDVAASRRAQQVRRLPVGREHGRASRRSLPQARAEGRHPVENRPQRLAEQAAAEIAAESGRCRLASAHRPPHEGSIDPPQRRRSIHRAPADMMRHVERPGGVLPMGLPEGGPLP